MKNLRLTVGFGLSAIWCCGAFAREADVLDFSGSSVSAQAKQDADWHARSPGEGVAAAMQTHFERNGADNQGGDKGGDSNNLGDRLTRGLISPARLQGRWRASSANSDIYRGFEREIVPDAYEYCDGGRYAPTWWLPSEVENRRALYFDRVAAIACEAGLPTRLLDAVVAQESGYKSWAVSSAGAMGIMQIMPGSSPVRRRQRSRRAHHDECRTRCPGSGADHHSNSIPDRLSLSAQGILAQRTDSSADPDARCRARLYARHRLELAHQCEVRPDGNQCLCRRRGCKVTTSLDRFTPQSGESRKMWGKSAATRQATSLLGKKIQD